MRSKYRRRSQSVTADFINHPNYPEGLRPSPTRFRLRAKRYGETSPEPRRRRALVGPHMPHSARVARFAALARVFLSNVLPLAATVHLTVRNHF
jgi:hypothetical protein